AMQTKCMREPVRQREQPILLLIDDDMVSREVAATVLTLGGYTVFTAEDGESALQKIGDGGCDPSVILMDARLPGLSGLELIEELRTRCWGKLIVISGSDVPIEIKDAADGFLLKPFDSAALKSVLQNRTRREANEVHGGDPVISAETLGQLRSLMPETGIREIYVSVAADLRKRMAELEWAVGQGDGDEVRRIGHAIKGGCGMAGVLQAARVGATLEALPEEPLGNQLGYIQRLLSELRNAARNLERMLGSELPA